MIFPVPKPRRVKKESKISEWNRVRKELVKDFNKVGITKCEIRLPLCLRDYALGFAHTKKRRNVTDLKRVVLSCQNCHTTVEYACKANTGKTMEEFLEHIINARKIQP